MKIERLIGILSILLQREKVTAPELAEQFEVSGGPSNGTLRPCAGRAFLLPPPKGRAAASSLWRAIG